MQLVEIQAAPLEKLAQLLAPEAAERFMATAERARQLLAGRVVWNVNTTAHGGGVAEMLQALLAYGRGAGVDTRWAVIDGDPDFFAITKRLHNLLHGSPGDGGDLGAAEHAHYEEVLAKNLDELQRLVRPGDLVLLHDPQTAGLVDGVRTAGAHVIWRSHIGRDDGNSETERGWDFLGGYVERAHAFVFSRQRYVPTWLPPERVRLIAPSIDPFSTKNMVLDDDHVSRVLRRAGLIEDGDRIEAVEFTRRDGSPGFVRRHPDLLSGGGPPPRGAPLVVQVSRWDGLKDMPGVLGAFAQHVAPAEPEAHLMLVGPAVSAVSDDPEDAGVLAACSAVWAGLPEPVRRRCHLACIPMDDVDEDAVIVNAVQRHATVVVQKSLVEGFGLTVTEAMWKGRPVVASAVGGIQDQITDGEEGLLLPDPTDLEGLGDRILRVLGDPDLRERLGARAHERVRKDFLGDRHLIQYVDLFGDLVT
ncbi:glycosyl transferase family 1 [Intrasporangium oryzae NRRL B-24470]|uniref:Glycosyl transferase family 1 n=1 Tax=Intrasporangium oryzae NRRL B-24470 TaxID=1386089 RepID=W9GEY6_9MICO|nr:glycosyltransferase [Intrasporangium oryzae]EWT03393.1 glycosyl transferase family 1 [Intrasporangium oryzae NRRL B-24470]